jgi:hypothetical protein
LLINFWRNVHCKFCCFDDLGIFFPLVLAMAMAGSGLVAQISLKSGLDYRRSLTFMTSDE